MLRCSADDGLFRGSKNRKHPAFLGKKRRVLSYTFCGANMQRFPGHLIAHGAAAHKAVEALLNGISHLLFLSAVHKALEYRGPPAFLLRLF